MKKLGNIKSAYFGLGGPNNSLLGLHLVIGNDKWEERVSNMTFFDYYNVPSRAESVWDEEDRAIKYAAVMLAISALFNNCQVTEPQDLVGLNVVAHFSENKFISWSLL